ncbi:uncharacterized protein LOC103974984 isoform X2 [Musa acuminata AAA Group]|uniref:uncharacterized protein LOC103974984 isoform X2 n=1 Tax=Musa acuminata AAA Group TaxID=214697 RepID=UPI0031D9BA13
MARKRKTEEAATPLDEADRTLYSTFRGAANSLSQLYTQSVHHRALSFHAGERHALNEMDFEVENPSTSPISEFQQQTQSTMHFMNSSAQPLFDLSSQASTGCVPPSGDSDQAKNCVFSNPLSGPARGSFQHCHLAQGCGVYANGGARNHDPNHNQELNSLRSNESSMDMNLDSPTHQSYC